MGKAFIISRPNLLADFGYCESWSAGTSSAPDGWTMSGTAGSVARESTEVKYGTYSMKITAGSSASYIASTSLSSYLSYRGRTMTFGMWVKCSTINKVHIRYNDGVGSGNSSYHTGSGAWEFLTVTFQESATASELTLSVEVINNAIVAYCDGGILVEGETATLDLSSYLSDWNPSAALDYSSFDIARRHSVFIDPESVLARERKISLAGNVKGTDYANCRALYDAIIKEMLPGERWFYLYDDRYLKGYLTKETTKYKASLCYLEFTFDVIFPVSFYNHIARLRESETISSSPTSFNFSYTGGAFSKPKITFAADQGGDISSCVLQNLTTGESISFSGTVSSTNSLVVDCDEQTVLNNGVDSISYFTGDFLQLIPGTNYLKFTGSKCTIKIDYFKRWFS